MAMEQQAHGEQKRLVESMLNPAVYDHPVTQVDLIETHISWVFLAGEFVYKVKKPVDFGFLDFSTLALRQHFCAEELRLNRRLAPELYVDVVSIGGSADMPRLHAHPVLEYAVKMRRFPQAQQLDEMLSAGALTTAHMERFAVVMDEFHGRTPIADARSDYGTPAQVFAPMEQNFEQISANLPDPEMQQQLNQLEHWSRAMYAQLRTTLQERKDAGFIRECHGDAHLGNMVWFNDAPVLFDCIEFNPALRWIDTMNEVAFLVMDLDYRGRQDLGWSFLNRYLEYNGDYSGLQVLDFYKVYRALVRAKVTCMRLAQTGLSLKERRADIDLVRSYLELARRYTHPRRAQLIITHGFSGSGKTSFIDELAPLLGAICVHSDHERKRLFGLSPEQGSRSSVRGGIYSAAASRKTYACLHDLAENLLNVGITTIVDATFLKQQDRCLFSTLAQRHKLRLTLLDFCVPETELRRRIRLRQSQNSAVSEAGEEVLDEQMLTAEELGDAEIKHCIRITSAVDAHQVAAALNKTR